MRELRLPRSELAERLRDGHRLDAAAEDRVQFGASRRQAKHGLSIYASLQSGDEVSARKENSESLYVWFTDKHVSFMPC